MAIVKSTRHPKIIGEFGESAVCNWLSRSGFEVARIDHTGIDVIAYNPRTHRRLGITVKSRTRSEGSENDSVSLFSYRNGKDDRNKTLTACQAFGCDPWVAVYVESTDDAAIFLTSLANYDAKYRRPGTATDDWKMTPEQRRGYAADRAIKHVRIIFDKHNWTW